MGSRGAVALGPRTGLPLRSSWRGAALSAMTPRAHCIVYVSGITRRTLPQQSEGRASGQNKKAVGAGTNAMRLALGTLAPASNQPDPASPVPRGTSGEEP